MHKRKISSRWYETKNCTDSNKVKSQMHNKFVKEHDLDSI